MDSKPNFRVLIITVLMAVTGCASDVIQLAPNEKEPVREEQSKYGVTCFGPNLRNFQWRGPKGIISQSPEFRVHSQVLDMHGNQAALLLVFESVREEDVGSYTCTAFGPDKHSQSTSINLSVTKILEFDTPNQQTANENFDYIVKCKVKGDMHPTFMWSYGAQTFKEKTANGKYSVQEGGLLIRNVTHLDAGTYTCRAFETTSESSVSGSKMIDLKVKHKPVFLSQMEGDPVNLYVFQSDSVNLTCENSAEPVASMKWVFEGKKFTNPDDHYIVTYDRPEKLGLYECSAVNSLGRITRRFHLIEGFKPKTPSSPAVARVGDNYIELQVAAGDNEDELIGYRIEYEEKLVEPDGRTFQSVKFINFNTTEGPFALVNLKPNTEYTTRLLARNRAGNSEYTSPLTVRTLPSVDSGATALFDGLRGRPTIVAAVALLAAGL